MQAAVATLVALSIGPAAAPRAFMRGASQGLAFLDGGHVGQFLGSWRDSQQRRGLTRLEPDWERPRIVFLPPLGEGVSSRDYVAGRLLRGGRQAVVRRGSGAEGRLANGFYRANLFVVILLVSEVVSGLMTSDPAKGSYATMVSVLLTTSAVLRVLRSAAIRQRLSGTTFRVLALSLVASFSAIFYHISFQLWRLLFGLPGPLRNLPVYPVFIAVVALGAGFYSIRTAYGVLQQEGLPDLGLPRIKNILALGYAVTMAHQVVWGAGLLLYSNLKTAGALRCFVLAACAYVCQSAASTGLKRLSSGTYKTLNVVLFIDSAVRLGTALGAVHDRVAIGTAKVAALPAMALASSAFGWLVGKLAK